MTFAENEGALIVGLQSRLKGVVRVRVHKGKRLLGRCRVRTPGGRALACKARLPLGMSPRGARAIVTLRVKGRLVAVVRPRLAEAQHDHGHMHDHGR